jgi:O-acetyl-ADP-ribose deacetylase (regulator of RNase III)
MDPRTPENRLGSFSMVRIPEEKLRIYNAYGQLNYGKGRQINYDALRSSLSEIAEDLDTFATRIRNGELRIGAPRLGAGLAGGEWKTIETILSAFPYDIEIWTK